MEFITDTLMIFVRAFQEIDSFTGFVFWLIQVVGCIAFVFLILLKISFFDICFKRFAIAACVFSFGGVLLGLFMDGNGSFILGQAIALTILLLGIPLRLYVKEED